MTFRERFRRLFGAKEYKPAIKEVVTNPEPQREPEPAMGYLTFQNRYFGRMNMSMVDKARESGLHLGMVGNYIRQAQNHWAKYISDHPGGTISNFLNRMNQGEFPFDASIQWDYVPQPDIDRMPLMESDEILRLEKEGKTRYEIQLMIDKRAGLI